MLNLIDGMEMGGRGGGKKKTKTHLYRRLIFNYISLLYTCSWCINFSGQKQIALKRKSFHRQAVTRIAGENNHIDIRYYLIM